jgi:hypothetical protein
MCVPITIENKPLSTEVQPSQPDLLSAPLVEEIVTEKRRLLKEGLENRYKGGNLVGETVTVLSDFGTAGFSVVQGLSLVMTAPAGLLLVGSISGLVGGILNMGQGLYVLKFAVQSLLNHQYKQGVRLLLDAVLLIGIGLFMTLISLSTLGVKLGLMGTVAANPYVTAIVIPALFLCLTLPGLVQIGDYMMSRLKKEDTASKLQLDQIDLGNRQECIAQIPLFNRLAHLSGSVREKKEALSDEMEKIAEELGVEAAIEVLDLLRRLLDENQEEDKIRKQIELCKEKIGEWNRMVALRTVQLFMYAATAPLGVASNLIASAGKAIGASSKFFLTLPSSAGAYMDLCKPLSRNSVYVIPKVAVD